MTTFAAVVAWVIAGIAALAWWFARRAARDRAAAHVAAETRANAALAGVRAEAARLTAALAGTSDGLIVLDADGRIVATNPAAEELAQLAAPCLGRRLEEVSTWAPIARAVAAARASHQVQTFELSEAAANGRALAVRVRDLAGAGTVIGIDDTSRLKRLESLRRDFVANVSHELKTPLAAIQGFVETMLDDPGMEAATRLRFLERIARQTERLTTLVADLLTLSRLDDEGDAGRDQKPCDFVAVLGETVRDLLPMAERGGLSLHGEFPEGAVWVRSDREALRQVAGNLVDNAIKYTGKGGRVRVLLTLADARARLEVSDTGIGLSPEDQERVFERFYRVDRARSRDLGGTGLGLSIVKNTVKALGGEVGVRSRLGTGSTFWVELPIDVRREDGLPDVTG
jgi:two-component system phosphate regulon sensor histidine kinase PhoR